MLTDNHIKEGLSVAYIHAVATTAGFSCSIRSQDYGIDGSINDIQIRSPNGRRFESGFGIDFQAKASQNCVIGTKNIVYDLEAKTYFDLIETSRGRPLILVLMALPKNRLNWLSLNHKRLLLRRCAWWLHLRGEAATTNKESVRIRIPRSNIFDVASLESMMQRVKSGALP